MLVYCLCLHWIKYIAKTHKLIFCDKKICIQKYLKIFLKHALKYKSLSYFINVNILYGKKIVLLKKHCFGRGSLFLVGSTCKVSKKIVFNLL